MACKHSICGVCGGKKIHTKYIGVVLNDICSSKCQAASKDECSCKCEGKFHKGANKDLMEFLLEPSTYAPIEKTKSKSKKVIFQPITMYDYLAEFLNGVRIKTSSFDRHSDRNYRKDNKKLTLFWLSPKGQNIDTLANDFISETGFSNYDESDIINAIVNYINDYPSGLKQYIKDVEAERIRSEEFYGQGMYENNYNNEPVIFGAMKFKKGSKEAKAYMAKLRAAKGKKTPAKKVSGIKNTLKRKAVSIKKNVAYSVIDKTLKNAPTQTAKDVLNRAKGIIKNTYLGVSELYQIIDYNNKYYSRNLSTGAPTFKDNKEFGYTFTKEEAEQNSKLLNRSGFKTKVKKYSIGAIGKTKFTFDIYKLNEYGDIIPSSKKTMTVTRANKQSASEIVYKKYPYKNHRIELSNSSYIGKNNKYHKDSKSHNVNIKVISGLTNKEKDLKIYKEALILLEFYEVEYKNYINILKDPKYKVYFKTISKTQILKEKTRLKSKIKEQKKHLSELKKLI